MNMEEVFKWLSVQLQLLSAWYWIIVIACIALGGIVATYGRKHFKWLLFASGFLWTFSCLELYGIGFFYSALAGVINGAIWALLFPVWIFFMGLFFGATILALPCYLLSIDVQSIIVFLDILALACGIVAVIFRKHIIIPMTALTGAGMLAMGLLFFSLVSLSLSVNAALIVALLAFVACAAGGIYVQYKYTAKDIKDTPLKAKKIEADGSAA